MLVVPLNDERCFSRILRSVFRYRGQLQDALERSVESLDHSNATMLVDGPEAWQDAVPIAPLLFKVFALEFAPLIDNEMFGFCLFPFDDQVQSCGHFLRRRPLFECSESHGTSRKVVHNVQLPPADGPMLPECVGQPRGPEAAANRHGG